MVRKYWVLEDNAQVEMHRKETNYFREVEWTSHSREEDSRQNTGVE